MSERCPICGRFITKREVYCWECMDELIAEYDIKSAGWKFCFEAHKEPELTTVMNRYVEGPQMMEIEGIDRPVKLGDFAKAALCYLEAAIYAENNLGRYQGHHLYSYNWPWDSKIWAPEPQRGDRIRKENVLHMLEKTQKFLAAEIESLYDLKLGDEAT